MDSRTGKNHTSSHHRFDLYPAHGKFSALKIVVEEYQKGHGTAVGVDGTISGLDRLAPTFKPLEKPPRVKVVDPVLTNVSWEHIADSGKYSHREGWIDQ